MSEFLNKKTVLRVKNILNEIAPEIELMALNTTARSAEDAAESLNKDVGSIVKSILVKDQNAHFYLCLCSGDKKLQFKKISEILDRNVSKATAEEVKLQTGFSIGGVCPVGHLKPPKRVLLDTHLKRFETIYTAGGHPFVVFATTYKKLLQITNAEPIDITS